MKLLIVESPAKCKTIQRYLGNDYEVRASLGHVRDLKTNGKGGLGVDVENGFMPSYQITKHKQKVVHDLQLLSKKADEVILATDPDREGEAIAWHLAQVLGLNEKTNKRLEFHEITRDSITQAMKNPRTIDFDLVASQETRRILDRIIGFKLSTLLNKKIHSRSAGRVQSASLKLIYDQEMAIRNFVSEEYWNLNVSVLLNGKDYSVNFVGDENGQKEITNGQTANALLKRLDKTLTVNSVAKSIKTIESCAPFTTSTLQQEAFSKLKFKTKRTQAVAQSLYEGFDVNGEHVGLITYMRTDSTRLSPTFIARAKDYIIEKYGKEYWNGERMFKKANMSQDAHEAIRPTSNHRTPESIRQYLTPDQYNLYKLIYNRAHASLMKPKKEEVLTVNLEASGLNFKTDFTRTIFQGFEIAYKNNEEKDYYGNLPAINKGDNFLISKKEVEQKFTQPPARFTEAKLVKQMEEVGIGRPSTYASTIETLHERGYVKDEKGTLVITEQGIKTIEFLDKYFADIVNTKYTAQMEKKLDMIQDRSESRLKMLTDFYYPFDKEIQKTNELIKKEGGEETGEKCPLCGKPLVRKEGRNGSFVGCSDFPHCKYVVKVPAAPLEYTGNTCPQCGRPMVYRLDKKGHKFEACSGYPKCKYVTPMAKPTSADEIIKKCPECGGDLIKKKGKYGYFLGCSNFPKCKHMEKISRKKHA